MKQISIMKVNLSFFYYIFLLSILGGCSDDEPNEATCYPNSESGYKLIDNIIGTQELSERPYCKSPDSYVYLYLALNDDDLRFIRSLPTYLSILNKDETETHYLSHFDPFDVLINPTSWGEKAYHYWDITEHPYESELYKSKYITYGMRIRVSEVSGEYKFAIRLTQPSTNTFRITRTYSLKILPVVDEAGDITWGYIVSLVK